MIEIFKTIANIIKQKISLKCIFLYYFDKFFKPLYFFYGSLQKPLVGGTDNCNTTFK